MEWKPIETAPKDGTHLILFTEGYVKIRIGWFYNNAWQWDGDYHGVRLEPPTHWMPLPEPPKTQIGPEDV